MYYRYNQVICARPGKPASGALRSGALKQTVETYPPCRPRKAESLRPAERRPKPIGDTMQAAQGLIALAIVGLIAISLVDLA